MGLADEPGEYQPRPLPTARIFSAFLGEAAQMNAFWSLGSRACTCSRRLPPLSLSRLLSCSSPLPFRPSAAFSALEGGGGGRRLRACRDLCQARRDQCAGGPGPFPTAAGERRARGGAAPHTGTSSPGGTRRTGLVPLAAIDANLLAAFRTVATLAEAGNFALFPLDANYTHHRRRAAHRQLPIGGVVPRRGHLAPGEPDAHAGVDGAAAGGQDPDQGGAARPPGGLRCGRRAVRRHQGGARSRRRGGGDVVHAPGDRDGRRQSEGHDRDDDDGLS